MCSMSQHSMHASSSQQSAHVIEITAGKQITSTAVACCQTIEALQSCSPSSEPVSAYDCTRAAGGRSLWGRVQQLHAFLQQCMLRVQGMESVCVRYYGEALEVIPYTLAENAGLQAIAIVTELRNRHAQAGHSYYIHCTGKFSMLHSLAAMLSCTRLAALCCTSSPGEPASCS